MQRIRSECPVKEPVRGSLSASYAGVLTLFGIGGTWLLVLEQRDYPNLHLVLDTGSALLSGVLALLFWDVGTRVGRAFPIWVSASFALTSASELVHVLVTIDWWGALAPIAREHDLLRPATWPLAAHILPLGLGASLVAARRESSRALGLVVALLCAAAAWFFPVFITLPRYTAPTFLGITRPTLIAVPLLWVGVGFMKWRLRTEERTAAALSVTAPVIFLGSLAMLYSTAPHDSYGMIAHLSKVVGYLVLLLWLMRRASLDMFARIRAEQELSRLNEGLEHRVRQRTAQLEVTNRSLEDEIAVRKQAEHKAQAQLQRLNLLHQITRAIGDRQDLRSIFQAVIRGVEDQLPVDFGCVCLYDQAANALIVTSVGAKSEDVAVELAMTEQARIAVDENGLSRCVRGQLVYEPSIVGLAFPFPQRLSKAGLCALVIAPLLSESRVFGVLVTARREPHSFRSGECEFLRQLSEHVALAAHQAQLYRSLQLAYEDLQRTQQAVLQQERLRALGQMAGGIAHDINNAISPVALYTEVLIEQEADLSERARAYLGIIQRAIDDVAHTVTRMREFYRQREPDLTLAPLQLNDLVGQVTDLTRARWSDIPLQRGTVIEMRSELSPNLPAVMGVESEIREALTNLVFNAVDAMPEGGTLTIRTRVTGTTLEPGLVVVEVMDTGIGMNEETRRRCLEPFFTTKGERGTGLGLAMVYGVSRRHGAEIDIESTPQQGTTVRLTFAAVSTAAVAARVSTRVSLPSRLRILAVDDDPLLLKSLRDTLETDGHVVVTAKGGQAGIDAFCAAQAAGQAFAIVLTDLGMPYVDGRKVAHAVKEASPSTPIILLTGWGQRLVDEGEVPPQVDRVLGKPVRLHELREALSQICTDQSVETGAGLSRVS